MRIEMKEVVTLSDEEKKVINEAHFLMLEILEQVNDPDIYNATKQICDGMEEFCHVVDTEE